MVANPERVRAKEGRLAHASERRARPYKSQTLALLFPRFPLFYIHNQERSIWYRRHYESITMLTTAMRVAPDGNVTPIKPNGPANGHLQPPAQRKTSHTYQTRSTSLQLVPEDENTQFHTETIKAKRASRRTATDDDDKVIVGTKVEEGHSNYEIA